MLGILTGIGSLTAEQRLTKSIADLMRHPKWNVMVGVIMMGKKEVIDGDVTACTDGVNEKYGKKFIDSLNDAELRFLILHELFHKLGKDLTTWQDIHRENPDLANRACDYANNLTIVETDAGEGYVTMPKGGLLDPRFTGMHAGKIFDLLKKEQQQKQQQQQAGDGERGEQGEDEAGTGQGGAGDEAGGFDTHDWEGAAERGEAENADIARDIEQALRQGALLAGKLGSGGSRVLGELLAPKVDWREVLREFLMEQVRGNEYATWRRPNRRFIAEDIYMPSGASDQVGELLVAIDTSGSIGSDLIAQFLGEVVGICETAKPDRIRLVYWDTKVCREEMYEGEHIRDLAHSTKPAGGGGTRPSCVTEYMRANEIKPKCAVVLTDGYVGADWGGEWPCPVLWAVLGNKRAVAATGVTVHID